jgi:hypothetical protein
MLGGKRCPAQRRRGRACEILEADPADTLRRSKSLAQWMFAQR